MQMFKVMMLGAALAVVAAPAMAQSDTMTQAKSIVEQFSRPNPPWKGPTTGPKAEPGKLIVYISTDQRNGGAHGVGEGMVEAAKVIGWKTRVLDGQGTVSGRASALSQAISLHPDVIVLGGIDGNEQKAVVAQAATSGIKIIGWHATAKAGPAPDLSIFTDITTDPLKVAKAAASLAVIDSDGKAGVVIFTDSTYKVAVAKSDEMANVIKDCKTCNLLEVIDTPLSDTSIRMPPLTTNLLTKYGARFTYALSINDLTFDFMAPALASAGIAGDGLPHNISAGDGSAAAFQRIRNKQYQIATVAEPLRLQGWQIVDEANRALHGQPDSGFVAIPHLFTPDNIAFDGGKNNEYDPDNGYRDAYKKIWGVH
jgi:ribose transport system substrate-binding protein